MQHLIRNREFLEMSEKTYLRYFSPITLLNRRYNTLFLKNFARGTLLDAGAGYLHNKPLAILHCDKYVSMDITPATSDLDYIGDIQNMEGTPSGSYDTILLTDVLEHVPRPSDAMKECHRILRPNGTLIGSCPYLSRLHMEPHDYQRFTKYGLAHLLDNVGGFNQWAIIPAGGLVSFIGHQFATLFVCATLSIPLVGTLLAKFNHSVNLRIIRVFDKWFGMRNKMPCMYFFLATKGEFTADQQNLIRHTSGFLLSKNLE